MKWNSVKESTPKPYQIIKAKGKWTCDKMLYLDDKEDGWEQKTKGWIEITHWMPIMNKVKS